ncbi:MAG: hypothetical protein NZ521_12180 [Flammeovirgaceae bacterium]|nr:hypothetical protein [Flammeovirgaceae bacterium]MDW8288682.1 hypothetical protein [Flammeovirgaceae bacterium]
MRNFLLWISLFMIVGSWQKVEKKPLIALQITVLDDKGNVQEGATVTLYEKEEDYKQNKNAIKVPEKTNKKGRVMFKWDLKEISYFIRAEKGNMNNDGGGIKTEKLVKNRINKVNVIISEM